MPSPTELKIRRFLKHRLFPGPSISSTLVKLNRWAQAIRAEDPEEEPLSRVSVKAVFNPAADAIENIASGLIEQAAGIDYDLLSKSLQETLFYCIGTDTGVDYAEVKARLAHSLRHRGKSLVVERFLSLCVFNFLWHQVGESFRAAAPTAELFEKDIDAVERTCQRIVSSVWTVYESRQDQLDTNSAQELLQKIEQQLRGDY